MERLERSSPVINPMFGCHAIYVANKIVLILRNKENDKQDNGVWLATTLEHHESLKKILPSMQSIHLFGDGVSGWQNIPSGADDFEESVMTVCDMILKNDHRIGKIPKVKRRKKIIKKR